MQEFKYGVWMDDSEPDLRGSTKKPITFIQFHEEVKFSTDEETTSEIKKQKQDFLRESG